MDNPSMVTDRTSLADRVGFWAASLTALLAAVSFGVAVTTPPRTGPFAAAGSALAYPYAAAARFVPRDFVWMFPALLMMLAFLVLAACVRERAVNRAKTRHLLNKPRELLQAIFSLLRRFGLLSRTDAADDADAAHASRVSMLRDRTRLWREMRHSLPRYRRR